MKLFLLILFGLTSTYVFSQEVYMGASVDALWASAQRGDFHNAAGGGAALNLELSGNSVYTNVSGGYFNFVGDPHDYKSTFFRGSIGMVKENFTGLLDVSRFWYFDNRKEAASAAGVGMRAHVDVEGYRIWALGRIGMFLVDNTTLYQSISIGVVRKLEKK